MSNDDELRVVVPLLLRETNEKKNKAVYPH